MRASASVRCGPSTLAAPDLLIEAARAEHQGAGPHASLVTDPNEHDQVSGHLDDSPRPAADLRPLRKALEHVRSHLPEIPAEEDDEREQEAS